MKICQNKSLISRSFALLSVLGLFRIVADTQPYHSIQEIVDSLRISSHRLGQPVFSTANDLKHKDGTVKKGSCFRVTGHREVEGRKCVDCELAQNELKRHFTLELSVQGEFYECDDSQFYTLKELAEWKISSGRTRTVTKAKSTHLKDDIFPDPLEDYKGELTLTPVHEIQAIMKCKSLRLCFSVCKSVFFVFFLKVTIGKKGRSLLIV